MTLLSHFEVRVACMRSKVQVARQTSIVVSPIPQALYTGIGRTAILLSLHERNYIRAMAKYAFRCVTHSFQLQYQYRIVTTGILLNTNSVQFSQLYCFFRVGGILSTARRAGWCAHLVIEFGPSVLLQPLCEE